MNEVPIQPRPGRLGALLLLFVASRVGYLLLLDPAAIVQHGGDEQLYRGTIGKELIAGLSAPFLEYRADNYAGGSLVIGALAAGFFLVFGSSVFALKLAPVLLFTLALLCWYLAIRRAAGERVAGLFALLFCLSPPHFTQYSVTAMGYHSESILFTGLSLLLFFKMNSDNQGSSVVPALLGVTAGFGLWFSYTYAITPLAMAIFAIFNRDTRPTPRQFGWLAAGFAMGLSPWIVMNVETGFAGLVIGERSLSGHFGIAHAVTDLTDAIRWLAPIVLVTTLGVGDRWDLYGWVANGAYFALLISPLLVVLIVGMVKRDRRRQPVDAFRDQRTLASLAMIYLAVLTLAIQFSDFRAPRYRVPAYPFLFCLAALSLARLQQMQPLGRMPITGAFVALASALAVAGQVLSADRPGWALAAKGYSYASLPRTYFDVRATQPQFLNRIESGAALESFPWTALQTLGDADRSDLARGIVHSLAASVSADERLDFSRFERLVPLGFERHFAYAFGLVVGEQHWNELSAAVTTLDFLHDSSGDIHEVAVAGLLASWSATAPAMPLSADRVGARREALASSPFYWRAVGHVTGRHWQALEPSWTALNQQLVTRVPQLPPEQRVPFLQGVGESLFAEPPIRPAAILPRHLSPPYDCELLEGWGLELGRSEFVSRLPWRGPQSPFWSRWTRGVSAEGLRCLANGRAVLESLLAPQQASTAVP